MNRPFYELMQSDDPQDQVIVRLVGSLATHSAFSIMTASLIYELHAQDWEAWRAAQQEPLPELQWR